MIKSWETEAASVKISGDTTYVYLKESNKTEVYKLGALVHTFVGKY